MKSTTFVIVAGLTLGATTLAAAPVDWIEQHFKAKLGRNTPVEEARLRAEQANSAFRAAPEPGDPDPHWIDQHLKRKTGRYSGTEEARLRDLRDSTAFRQDTSPATPGVNWIERHNSMKQGH